jgi:hypothetical protein
MARRLRLPVRATLLSICGIYVVILLYDRSFTRSLPLHRLEAAGFILGGVAFLCSSLVTAALRRERAAIGPPAAVATPNVSVLLAGYLVALAVSLLLYWPVLFAGYFFDDYVHIGQVLEGELGFGTGQRFRPTSFILWRLLLSAGFKDVALHFVNVALHAANAVLTFVVAARLGFPWRLALIAAAVFITFPTSVEAVSWVVALPDLLTTTLCLAFLTLLPGATSPRTAWAAGAVMAVALCTKETAIAIPAIAVAAYGWSPRRRDTRTWLMGAAVLGAGIFAAWRIATPTGFNFLQQPSRYLFQKMISRAVGALALPWKQGVLDAHPAATFLWGAAVTIVFTRYFIRCGKDSGAAGTVARFGAWIGFAIAPVYTWFFISPDLAGGRYLYLAIPAWSMLLITCVASVIPRPEARRGIVVPSVAVGVMLIAFVFGVRSSVGAWTAASHLRDDVLAAADSALDKSPCERVVFLNLPEVVDGAFVFANGFRAALYYHGIARAGRPDISLGDAEPGCRLVWNGERKRFQNQPDH